MRAHKPGIRLSPALPITNLQPSITEPREGGATGSDIVTYKGPPPEGVSNLDEAALGIYCWRMEQLLRAGYSRLCADALAEDVRVDLHLACDLLARGCDERVAYRILS